VIRETEKEMKLKKDGSPKLSGGKRQNSGRPMKTPPEGMLPWEQQLERAFRLAANNMFVLPRDKFFTKREVRNIYGKMAHDEFSQWFVSVLRFDQNKADAVRHKQARGLFNKPPSTWKEKSVKFYTPEKYANWLIDHKCFTWMSILKDEHHKEIWKKYADQGRAQ
jgi:hypothetical protein